MRKRAACAQGLACYFPVTLLMKNRRTGWVVWWVPGLLALCGGLLPRAALAAPPRYDHVVVVIEENRTPAQIIGDLADAPYVTWLANGGVQLSSMYALVHPS